MQAKNPVLIFFIHLAFFSHTILLYQYIDAISLIRFKKNICVNALNHVL
jgi:hypothetical protein